MDGVHDMGGMHGFGPVVVEGGDEVFHEAWEPRVFALSHLSNVCGLVGGPGGRAAGESMDAAHYLEASYYERWLWTAERQLEAKGTIHIWDIHFAYVTCCEYAGGTWNDTTGDCDAPPGDSHGSRQFPGNIRVPSDITTCNLPATWYCGYILAMYDPLASSETMRVPGATTSGLTARSNRVGPFEL